MTSAEYRARAVQLLTGWHTNGLTQVAEVPPAVVAQAAVWAQLATAAAIEQAQQATSQDAA
jgi:hypothetical protein